MLIEPEELEEGNLLRLQGRRAAHLRSVLKAEPGARLRAGVVEGPLGYAELQEALPGGLLLRFVATSEPPPRPPVDLLLSLPRPKALKRLYGPLATLGLGHLVLVGAAKVEPSYFDSHALDPRLAGERMRLGLEQAVDTRVPRLSVRRSLRRVAQGELDDLFGSAHRLLADPLFSRSPREACATLRARDASARAVLAMGPEGGFTPEERELLLRQGFEGVGLGPRILRSETAALCLLTLAHDGLRAAETAGNARAPHLR